MSTPKTRETLSADGLIALVGKSFRRIEDHRPQPTISLSDILMSAFGLFSLKNLSLLALDERRL